MSKSKKISSVQLNVKHWLWLILLLAILQLMTITQIFYPVNRLLPFVKIDGLSFGGWTKTDTSVRLNKLYKDAKLNIYLGKKSEKPYLEPSLDDIGMAAINGSRMHEYRYPWYLRLVPTSILWGQYIFGYNSQPTYSRSPEIQSAYIANHFGNNCTMAAKDASLEYLGGKFKVVPSQTGGSCDINNVRQLLSAATPRLDLADVVIPAQQTKPAISDSDAVQYGNYLIDKVGPSVTISVNGNDQLINSSDILGWMDFGNVNNKITYSLSSLKAADYLENNIASKVRVEAGTTTVTTYDFYETSRIDGVSGVDLNVTETLKSIENAIDNGGSATAVTITVPPRVVYNRGYSPTDSGISALLEQYANSGTGISSVSFIELSGKHRRASYNSDDVLVSASTYKLFTAYSVLKRIENGYWSWTDQILDDGRDLAACFNDMIVYSDNDCAEAISEKAGWQNVTDEAHDIGCIGTSLSTDDGYARTTAADLSLFLAQLQTGQILNLQSSRDTLINAMKSNVYRDGIPSGVSGEVADKVGFIDGVLNDAAIVYSPTGTYVLVIMSDGSSWATIADLANKVGTLQAQ